VGSGSLVVVSSLSTMSLADIALSVIADDHGDVYRSVIGWLDEVSHETQDSLSKAIAYEPPATGDERADALLAAAAEHAAFHADVCVPDWLTKPNRFLRTAWFPIDLPSGRVRGLVTSPASFARRGIFIDRSDLDRV
jgi:hypothetical protein